MFALHVQWAPSYDVVPNSTRAKVQMGQKMTYDLGVFN